MRSKWLELGLAAVLAGSATGCTHYLRVDTKLVESTQASQRDITPSAQYEQTLGTVHTVAVRAPDSCVDETASKATGVAAGGGRAVLKTSCGVEMAELERALTRAGYVVISWKALRGEAGDKADYAAASLRLGAQVLFQVNSLEKVTARPAQNAHWERAFFVSNDRGAALRPAEVDDATSRRLRALGKADEGELLETVRIGAMLDVNAIFVPTGQTMWFYRAVRTEASEKPSSFSLVAFESRHSGGWQRVQPRKDEAHGERTVRSSEVEAVSLTSRSRSDEDAKYFEFVRDVVKDFVTQFVGDRPVPQAPVHAAMPQPRELTSAARAPASSFEQPAASSRP